MIRPTMYLASMDIKTAFDVARPKHINKYGWVVAALLREMAGVEFCCGTGMGKERNGA